jgi:cyclophilin family peptidyl-prolyl cis-trans isomerase
MARRKPIRHSKQSEKKMDSKRTIQIVAIVVIVLILGIGAWLIINNQQKQAANALATKTASTAQAQLLSAAATKAASTPVPGAAKQWSSAPAMQIDTKKSYTATVKMAKGGTFVIQLYADKAPVTVNSFVFLARQGFFDGVTFHRVLEGFMAQGGDPTGTGSGGPGYKFKNEDSDLVFDKAGVVAMANSGRDTNSSQFFITFGPTPSLNGGYTIFGQVTSGMEVVNAITRRDPEKNPQFTGDAMESVTITEK